MQVDWDRFIRLAERHRIEGLAFEALQRASIPVGEGPAGQLRDMATDIAVRGLRMAVETARLQATLDAADVVNLVLKGAFVEALAWRRVGLKRAWDIDLLVLEADAAKARYVLERAGYRLVDPVDGASTTFDRWVELAKECVFVHCDHGFIVELHWRLTDVAGLLPRLDARSPAQEAALSTGLSLRGLAREPMFAYLCVHGASHAWSRLKWLADLGAILALEDEQERISLYHAATALGAGNCPAAALLLCERFLGLALPAIVAADISSKPAARILAALATEALDGGGGEADLPSRPWLGEIVHLSGLLFADGWRFRFREMSRMMVSVDDRMRWRLPPGLAFLYGPVRAPLWIWRRLARRARRT